MEQTVNGTKCVHWKQLQGNKFNRILHPAMLCRNGCLLSTRSSLIGASKQDSRLLTIHFDRDFVVAFIVCKLIRPLQNEGLEKILALVEDAWDLLHEPKKKYVQLTTPHDEERE